MKDEGSSVALPLVLVALFMGAVMAAGFFVVRKLHVGDASSSSATATPTSVLLPPPASSLVASSPTFVTPTPTYPTPTVLRPHGTASLGPLTGDPHAAEQSAAIARLRPGFRSCYNRGLAADPSMSGNITIEIEVSSNGDVASVTKVGGIGLSSDVETCIIRRARSATFDAPGGAGFKLRVPIAFTS